MRKVDLHCYPGTQAWIDSYGPFAEALGAYWKRDWVAKPEDEVIGEFRAAGVEAVLVAFDIESATGAPPCTNDYVAGEQLRLVVQGSDVQQYPPGVVAMGHSVTRNKGTHVIHAGGRYDSHLLVPVIP